jgi:hypothetical protein
VAISISLPSNLRTALSEIVAIVSTLAPTGQGRRAISPCSGPGKLDRFLAIR